MDYTNENSTNYLMHYTTQMILDAYSIVDGNC